MKLASNSILGRLAMASFFGLCSGACGGADKGGGGGSASPIPEDELPEKGAAALCKLLFECSCDDPGHPDEPTCVTDEMDEVSEEQLAAQAAGLIYDAQCAGDQVKAFQDAGCSPTFDFGCEDFCAAYHGEVPLDGSCVTPVASQPWWSDCAQGFWCVQGTCQEPCGEEIDLLGEGDACRDEMGQSLGDCNGLLDLICDYETGTCVELPGIGEPCYGSEVCAPGAVCDWSGDEPICIAAPGPGEACNYVCVDGYYCDGIDTGEGTCVALPGEGEPCALQGWCAEDLYCDANVCTPSPAWVCL